MRFACGIIFLAVGLSFAGVDGPSELTFNDLNGVPHRPLDPGDRSASVLIFYWHDCPISNSYAPELNRIFASRTNFAFYIVQNDPQLSSLAAKEHARQFDLHIPVLLDPSHRLVKLARATVTPEAVVLGKNAQVLYCGRIDNLFVAIGKKRSTATEHDLLDALDDIAAGRSVRKPETKAIGCLIQ